MHAEPEELVEKVMVLGWRSDRYAPMIVGLRDGWNLCLDGHGIRCQGCLRGRPGQRLRSRCASGNVQMPSIRFMPAILWFFWARWRFEMTSRLMV